MLTKQTSKKRARAADDVENIDKQEENEEEMEQENERELEEEEKEEQKEEEEEEEEEEEDEEDPLKTGRLPRSDEGTTTLGQRPKTFGHNPPL